MARQACQPLSPPATQHHAGIRASCQALEELGGTGLNCAPSAERIEAQNRDSAILQPHSADLAAKTAASRAASSAGRNGLT